MQVHDLDAVFAKPVNPSSEVYRFAHDDRRDAELADETAAIPTGRQSRDHDLVAIGSLASGAAEGVRLSVDGRVVLLDSPIVTAAQEPSLRVKKRRADWDPAFREALARFVYRDFQHLLEIL
jgi:hypothetical protein